MSTAIAEDDLMSGADPTEPDRAPRVPTRLPTCHAKAKSGQPCKRPVVPGATVCRYHGGNAPQVKKKAALRLLELVDPAIATLAREMVQADKSADRQRAANSILDRAGVPRQVDVSDTEAAKALLIERLLAMRDQAARGEDDQAGVTGADAGVARLTVAGSVVDDDEDSPTTTEDQPKQEEQ